MAEIRTYPNQTSKVSGNMLSADSELIAKCSTTAAKKTAAQKMGFAYLDRVT